jgi:outer membrane protein OmpA-like peptidoglycan-associated protein
MTLRQADVIEFPANPFVALADFLVLLILVLMLIIVERSIVSSGMVKRLAVRRLQVQLVTSCTADRASKLPRSAESRRRVLAAAYGPGRDFHEFWYDGDLQRFRFTGRKFFTAGSTTLSAQGRLVLRSFGELLKAHQGDRARPGHGLYKRVIVQGNADAMESSSSDPGGWRLSMRRAEAAAAELARAGLAGEWVEVSARGIYDRAADSDSGGAVPDSRELQATANRRIDIVVVYSGDNALEYSRTLREAPAGGAGG